MAALAREMAGGGGADCTSAAMTAPIADPGPRPELAWLPIERLIVDPRYQRDIETVRSRRHIARIAGNFRWSRFQAILVTPGERGWWLIIDGQHRVAAARLRGFDLVPSVVIGEVERQEQAASFVWANGARIAISAQALHHANVLAGDPESTALARICAECGVEIMRSYQTVKNVAPGKTVAIAALKRLLRLYGEDTTRHAVAAIARAYGDQAGTLRASFFQGAANFLNEGGDAAVLARVLAAHDWRHLEAVAQSAGSTHGMGRAVSAKLAEWAAAPPPEPPPAPEPASEIIIRFTDHPAAAHDHGSSGKLHRPELFGRSATGSSLA